VRRFVRAILLAAPVLAIVAAGIDHRWMDDDGFINLRVVRNLLHGHGPVFNAGERVEAVTSPLWIAVLALLGATGVRLEDAAVYAGIALAGLGVYLALRAGLCLGAAPAAKPDRASPLFVPLGAAIFVALPPAWDYASAGLEVGLTLAWLGGAFLASARAATGFHERRAGSLRLARDAALVGLGPLVRPELALHAVAPLGLLAVAAWRRSRTRTRPRGVLAVAAVVASAAALPVAYEIFRMGYYGSVAPNTALAKEAMLVNAKQGACYLDNFVGTYRLAWPFGVAAVAWVAQLVSFVRAERPLSFAACAAPPLAAAAHAIYVVRVGGDYMHGRMLLAPAFAALLPVAAIPLPSRDRPRPFAATLVVLACALPWVGLCVARLRMGPDNVCEIGEERGWYARSAKVAHPVRVDDYREHSFYQEGLTAMQHALDACPGLAPPAGREPGAGCRLLHLSEDEQRDVAAASPALPLAPEVSAEIDAVVSAGAVGIIGMLLPDRVHLVDRFGLADPLIAHRRLESRGRPGHEKTLPAAWTVARFAAPAPHEDAAVAAARHALGCGALGAIERAVAAPLDLGQFVDNVERASELARVRIPADPFEAEEALCGTPPLEETPPAGGTGGHPFHTRCPAGGRVTALRVTYGDAERAISGIQPVCSLPGSPPLAAPPAGAHPSSAAEVACPPGANAVGLRVGADDFVRVVGLVCGGDGQGAEAPLVGASDAAVALAVCPPGLAVVGLVGRSGDLIDRLGAECAAPPERSSASSE
jgi:arabinofuranosyltransferase